MRTDRSVLIVVTSLLAACSSGALLNGAEPPPSTYLKRFTYDTIGHANYVMKYLTDLVGAERIMLGSDYCFDMGFEKPVDVVHGFDWLSDDEKAAIIGGNACKALGLDYPPAKAAQ